MNWKERGMAGRTLRLIVAGSVALSVIPVGVMAGSREYGENGRMTGSESSTAKLSRDIAAANQAVARLNEAYGQQVGPQTPGGKAASELQQQIKSFRIPEKEKVASKTKGWDPITLGGLLGKVLHLETTQPNTREGTFLGTVLDNDGQKLSFTAKLSKFVPLETGVVTQAFSIHYSDGREIKGEWDTGERAVRPTGMDPQIGPIGLSGHATITYPGGGGFPTSGPLTQNIVFQLDTQGRITRTHSKFYTYGRPTGDATVTTAYNNDGSKVTKMTSNVRLLIEGYPTNEGTGRQESVTHTYANGVSVTKGTFVSTDGKTTTVFNSNTNLNGLTRESSRTTFESFPGHKNTISTIKTINGTKTEVVQTGTVWTVKNEHGRNAAMHYTETIVRVAANKTESKFKWTWKFSDGEVKVVESYRETNGIAFISLVPGIPSLRVLVDTGIRIIPVP
jgi:hypothetical protein